MRSLSNKQVRGIVCIENYGKIIIEDNMTINASDWAKSIVYGKKTIIKIYSSSQVSIANNVGMSNGAFVFEKSGIFICNNVMLGGWAKVYDTDFQPLEAQYRSGQIMDDTSAKSEKVMIEDGAFIGAGSFI